jgi:hypothetical protein
VRSRKERRQRREAKTVARKRAEQQEILDFVTPELQPSERGVAAPAPANFYPWTAFMAQSRAVREVFDTLLLPLVWLAHPGGPRVDVVVTQSRIVVLRGRRPRVASIRIAEISSVRSERSQKYVGGQYGGTTIDVVDVWLVWGDRHRLRLRFREPWLSEGSAIADALQAARDVR